MSEQHQPECPAEYADLDADAFEAWLNKRGGNNEGDGNHRFGSDMRQRDPRRFDRWMRGENSRRKALRPTPPSELETLRSQVQTITAENERLEKELNEQISGNSKIMLQWSERHTKMMTHLKAIEPVIGELERLKKDASPLPWNLKFSSDQRMGIESGNGAMLSIIIPKSRNHILLTEAINNLPALLSALRAMGEIGGGENG